MRRTYGPWIDYMEDAEHSVYHIAKKIFKDCSVECRDLNHALYIFGSVLKQTDVIIFLLRTCKEYSEKSDEE